MHDPDPKRRHFGISWHFMAFYGILAFLPKKSDAQVVLSRFYHLFDFLTGRKPLLLWSF